MIIAVDGPTASGKGTISKALAVHYGLPWLDTGLLYRAVGRQVELNGGNADDPADARGFRTVYTGPAHPYGGGLWPIPGLGIGYSETKIVECFDLFNAIATGKQPSPNFEDGLLTELVADADHVVLVAPLTDATRGLFNDELFAAMKPGVQLINVARGPIIDDGALLRALDSGIVACADIDATDPEPLPDGHWMYSHPAVRLSPHVSWNWSGAFQAMYATFVDNLRLYLNDEPLLSVVNPADGY